MRSHSGLAIETRKDKKGLSLISLSRCTHFSRLQPGEAGSLSFEHDGEHGGAFEFLVGKDRFFLGQCPGSGLCATKPETSAVRLRAVVHSVLVSCRA